MKNIVIINAYGSKNIGDGAILQVAKTLVEESLIERSNIYIFGEDPKTIDKTSKFKHKIFTRQLPYGYAIHNSKTKRSYIGKFNRFIQIWIITYFHIIHSQLIPDTLPEKGFYSYINVIKNADAVFSMGGGYFAPRNKYKDYFGLLLTLLPIYISKFYKKDLLFLPISFGSFPSRLQEKITFMAIKGTTVICREKISLKVIRNLDKDNSIRTFWKPDLALFLNPPGLISKPGRDNYIVLTAREWLGGEKQTKYEKALADFIDYIAQNYNLKTVIVSMVYNPLDDDDNIVAKRILKIVKNKKKVTISNAKTPLEVQKVIGHSRLAICTRLHSAILASTVETPFITIAYGIKTHGFLELFGLKEWNLDIENLTFENLLAKFKKLNNPVTLNRIKLKIRNKLKAIQPHRDSIKKEIYHFIYP